MAPRRRAACASPSIPCLGIHAQDDSFLDRAPWDLAGHAAGPLPAAAPLPPARDLPPPGAQAVRRRARPGAPRRASSRPPRRSATSTTTTRSRPATRRCRRASRASRPRSSGTTTTAYRYFMQTARMDLDDVNGNVEHGVHVAAMAGSWVSLVYGFAGLRDDDGRIVVRAAPPAGVEPPRVPAPRRGRDAAGHAHRATGRPTSSSTAGRVEIRHFGRPHVVPRRASRSTIDLDARASRAVDLRPRRRHHRHRRAPLPGVEAARRRRSRCRSTASSTSASRASAGWRAWRSSSRTPGQTPSLEDRVRLADRKNAYFRELIDVDHPRRPAARDRRAARRPARARRRDRDRVDEPQRVGRGRAPRDRAT